MGDPFLITGPALISFSGGRTSAYMLWRILQAHGGTLPADVVVAFANTGKHKTRIRNATPIPFRDLLVSIAQTANAQAAA